MPSLLRALQPYTPPPHTSPSSPQTPLLQNDLLLPLSKPKSGWTLIKNLRTSSSGWVPTSHLAKPSKGFYRATCDLGHLSTPEGQSASAVLKIKKDEMIEVTVVRGETWRYKKLDGSGGSGAVNPALLVKVELGDEPPAYNPPPPLLGHGSRAWKSGVVSPPPDATMERSRWSIFGSRRGKPSPTIEAKARTPLETDGKGHDSSPGPQESQGSYFDGGQVKKWCGQVEGDGFTLGGETIVSVGEPAREGEAPAQPCSLRDEEEEGAVWLGSV